MNYTEAHCAEPSSHKFLVTINTHGASLLTFGDSDTQNMEEKSTGPLTHNIAAKYDAKLISSAYIRAIFL